MNVLYKHCTVLLVAQFKQHTKAQKRAEQITMIKETQPCSFPKFRQCFVSVQGSVIKFRTASARSKNPNPRIVSLRNCPILREQLTLTSLLQLVCTSLILLLGHKEVVTFAVIRSPSVWIRFSAMNNHKVMNMIWQCTLKECKTYKDTLLVWIALNRMPTFPKCIIIFWQLIITWKSWKYIIQLLTKTRILRKKKKNEIVNIIFLELFSNEPWESKANG